MERRVDDEKGRLGFELVLGVFDLDARRFEGRLPGDLEIACFRLVQESVTNAIGMPMPNT